MSELAPFEARLGALIAALEPAARRKLARSIATRLRASQAQRIGEQLNPDGTPFEPRKAPKTKLRGKKGFVRRKMFAKIRTKKWLKIEATPESAIVTFTAAVQRMAQVHQHGLRDRVSRRGAEVVYAKRALLGLTADDEAAIEDEILTHLAAA